jgi:hypothetical protein
VIGAIDLDHEALRGSQEVRDEAPRGLGRQLSLPLQSGS